MSFDFGGLKYRKDSQQSLLHQSTGTSEPWELRGDVLRRALMLGGGGGWGALIKEGPTLYLIF